MHAPVLGQLVRHVPRNTRGLLVRFIVLAVLGIELLDVHLEERRAGVGPVNAKGVASPGLCEREDHLRATVHLAPHAVKPILRKPSLRPQNLLGLCEGHAAVDQHPRVTQLRAAAHRILENGFGVRDADVTPAQVAHALGVLTLSLSRLDLRLQHLGEVPEQ